MSPEMPPAEKVTKLFFILTLLGAMAWIGTIGFFVLNRSPTPSIDYANTHSNPDQLENKPEPKK